MPPGLAPCKPMEALPSARQNDEFYMHTCLQVTAMSFMWTSLSLYDERCTDVRPMH
jgi:hypothetical protein